MRDLHAIMDGYKVIIVVDSHELFDYCFPINPTDDRRQTDPEDLAESQAALSHLFKSDEPERPPVVLLPEYRDEIKGLMHAISRRAPNVYKAAEMIHEMSKAGDLDNPDKQQREKLEDVIQKSFQFLLTILLGIHSIGVERMGEVYDNGLTLIENAIEPVDRANFKHLWDEYRPTRIYETIFRVLEEDNQAEDLRDRENTRIANQFDASAIDRVIYLNSQAEVAARGGLLKYKYLFLYISSASKSRKVFNRLDRASALPRIKDRKYSFLRNRHQVLAYVIYRSRSTEGTLQRARETHRELRSLHSMLIRLKKLRFVLESPSNDCRECVLDGKHPTSCPLLNHCYEIMATSNKIKEKREEVNNWGLYKQITSYSYLLDADVQHLGYGVYAQLFKELLDSSEMRDIALERMHERHVWITRASDWMISQHSIGYDPDFSKDQELISQRNQFRRVDQYIPNRPRFNFPEYQEIIDLILEFFRNPKGENLVELAYDKFHALDPQSGQDEYDLLKCYLYLIFGFEGEGVHHYIENELLPKRIRNEGHAWRESLYVLCLSARRFGFTSKVEQYAAEGRQLFPDDARFLHEEALNIYLWRVQGSDCPYQISDAITASKQALELYGRHRPDSDDQIAANHNNIAYLLAFEVKTSNSNDREELTRKLAEARAHMNSLTQLIDKEKKWDPAYREFFHTDAFLKHQTVIHFWRGNERSLEDLKAELGSARSDINKAIEIYDCPTYQELRREIEDFYQRMR